MKIAVLADIHANLTALIAVANDIETWQPDAVVVAGDIVNRGPRPAQCLHFVQRKAQDKGWLLLGGNHEDFVVKLADELVAQNETPLDKNRYEFYRPVYWTSEKVMEDISTLRTLPFKQSITAPNGDEIRIVHASMRGNRDGIYPETPAHVLRLQIDPPPAVLCVGHTHRPLIRRLDDTLVVNVGSAGLPFDGDTRPSYARISFAKNQWHAEIKRVAYNFQQAELDYFRSGFSKQGGPLTRVMLNELRSARSLLFVWTKRYEKLILSGQISMAEAVHDYLISLA